MPTDCPAADEFASTPLQQHILDLLAGRALHTHDLVRAVGNARAFFSGHGGFWELRHLGLVVHDAAVGNYRPDRPPAGVGTPAAVGGPRARSGDLGHRHLQALHRATRSIRGDTAHATVGFRPPHTPAAARGGPADG